MKARTSECVTQGLGHRVRVKITWRRRPDKRTLIVLIIIPAGIPSQLMAQIHAEASHRLVVLVLRGAERLQNVELRYAAVNAGDTVAQVGRHSLHGLESDCGHSEMSVVGVEAVSYTHLTLPTNREV